MKFRILLLLAVFCGLTASVFSGSITVPAALILGFLASACLSPITRGYAFACPSPFEALRVATEHLPDDVHQKSVWHSVWLNAIPRTEFPLNAGVDQTTFVIGNSEPTSNSETWTEITQSGIQATDITTMCAGTYTDADVGYNEYTYSPRRFGLAGIVICRETLSFVHNPTQFLSRYYEKLVHRAKRSLEYQFRNAYTAIADKALARTGQLDITQGSTTFPDRAATSQLTWDYLDEAAITLLQNGATNPDGELITMGDDGPLFLIEIGIQMKNRLFTNVSGIRTDMNYAEMGKGKESTLFQRIGATLTWKNFRFVPDLYPTRYTYSPGVGYTEVNTWEMVNGSSGTVARLRNAWKTAPYEAARIINPAVMNARMVRPATGGLDWSPTNYTLEWVWKTGNEISETYCFDPFRDYGRHFARAIYAPEAVFPDYGMTIIYKRCPNDVTSAGCTYPY